MFFWTGDANTGVFSGGTNGYFAEYEHAAELGAIRMGTGPKARIGFDLATIEKWKRDHQIAPPKIREPTRRLTRLTAPSSDNLIPYEPLRHRA